jgi:hypothetical protein
MEWLSSHPQYYPVFAVLGGLWGVALVLAFSGRVFSGRNRLEDADRGRFFWLCLLGSVVFLVSMAISNFFNEAVKSVVPIVFSGLMLLAIMLIVCQPRS